MNDSHTSTVLKPSYVIPIAIVMGGFILAISTYSVSYKRTPTLGIVNSNAALIRGISATDHIFGNPAAKVIIVEYADFDCEDCKTFNDTMHQIVASEGARGDVAWIFRQFPLIEIHPNALSHARAAECAAQTSGSDAFWKFETALYKNQPVDPISYGTLAKEAGITGNAFATCYARSSSATSTVETRILADRQNALDMGAKNAPYSVILVMGKRPVVIDGAYTYDQMRQVVNQAFGN
ncbi:MAG: thioredoxin domain-containing protein [bacterium]|nr:thioredoxin domain-containing protein [bacterium]